MIIANGAVLTEYTDGTPPLPGNFPRRNRIISGLSTGVIVVEAGMKSGSLITARMALEQGRDVMAVPGRVDSPLSEGPLKLISEGAAPVRDADDVLCALGIDLPGTSAMQVESSPLLKILAKSPSTVDELAESTGRTVRSMLAELTELEIDGRIRRDINGNFTLK
jgi:DNA processing protein